MTTRATDVSTIAERLRTAMAQVPTAVSVITTQSGGSPHGTTVSAFMSLSIDPPMMLVSLDNASSFLTKIDHGALIGINVLTDQQSGIAAQFARKTKNMQNLAASWEMDGNRPPYIPGSLAWITFTVTTLVPAGDHTLVIGVVDEAEARIGEPLVYWQRRYGSLTDAGRFHT